MKTAEQIHEIVSQPNPIFQSFLKKDRTKIYKCVYSDSPIRFIVFYVQKEVLNPNKYLIKIEVPNLVDFIELEYRSRRKAKNYEHALECAIRWDGGSVMRQLECQLAQQKANLEARKQFEVEGMAKNSLGNMDTIISNVENTIVDHIIGVIVDGALVNPEPIPPRDQSIIRDLTLREKGLDFRTARHGHKLDEIIETKFSKNCFSWDISAVASKTIESMGYNEKSDIETYNAALHIAIRNAVRAWSDQQSILIQNSVAARKYKKPF